MTTASVLWRRLDTPGHDACRLEGSDAGWQIDGTAVFREDGVLARLDYQVGCDLEWVTQQGHVCGWLGPQHVEFTIVRTAGGVWTLNGDVVAELGSWGAASISTSASLRRRTCYNSAGWLWPKVRQRMCRSPGLTCRRVPSRFSPSVMSGGLLRPTGMRRRASPMRPCSRSRQSVSSACILDCGRWNPEHDSRLAQQGVVADRWLAASAHRGRSANNMPPSASWAGRDNGRVHTGGATSRSRRPLLRAAEVGLGAPQDSPTPRPAAKAEEAAPEQENCAGLGNSFGIRDGYRNSLLADVKPNSCRRIAFDFHEL